MTKTFFYLDIINNLLTKLVTEENPKGPEIIGVSLATGKTLKGSFYLDIINDTKLIKA